MLRLNVKTTKTPDEVLKKALEILGPEGQGFKVIVKTDKYVSFDDGTGGTFVSVSGNNQGTFVDLRTLERESQIQEFATKLK